MTYGLKCAQNSPKLENWKYSYSILAKVYIFLGDYWPIQGLKIHVLDLLFGARYGLNRLMTQNAPKIALNS